MFKDNTENLPQMIDISPLALKLNITTPVFISQKLHDSYIAQARYPHEKILTGMLKVLFDSSFSEDSEGKVFSYLIDDNEVQLKAEWNLHYAMPLLAITLPHEIIEKFQLTPKN